MPAPVRRKKRPARNPLLTPALVLGGLVGVAAVGGGVWWASGQFRKGGSTGTVRQEVRRLPNGGVVIGVTVEPAPLPTTPPAVQFATAADARRALEGTWVASQHLPNAGSTHTVRMVFTADGRLVHRARVEGLKTVAGPVDSEFSAAVVEVTPQPDGTVLVVTDDRVRWIGRFLVRFEAADEVRFRPLGPGQLDEYTPPHARER